ncbi:MAG: hypothetical protein V4687_18120 [Bacteroidota bacterium]
MKKTTKTEEVETEATVAKADITQLDLTKATKETNEYYYRTDGTLQGHKKISEQVDKAGYGTAKIDAKATLKKEVVVKESIPLKTWMWISGILIIVFGVLLIYFKRK